MNTAMSLVLGFRMLVAASVLGISTSALAQPYGYDCGPGMMGPGMMGPGMMGPGMMSPMRPGMMGPGMMGGWGMDHGMMMGPGMWGPYGGLNLTDEQDAKIAAIQDEVSKKHWDLMSQMQDEQFKLQQLYSAPTRDKAAMDESFKRIATLRRQMYDSTLDARKKMDAALTAEQRNQMRRGWQRSWGW